MLDLSLRTHASILTIFISLVGAACVACVAEGLSFLIVRPFSRSQHRKICVTFSRSFFLISTFLLEVWAGITFKSYGDTIDPKASHVAVINHRSDVDWLLGLAYVARFGYPYPGNAKSVVKASLGKVPFLGLILRFAEFLFLKRDWATDREQFLNALLTLKTYADEGAPLWFVLYPEGTRLTKEKLEYSQSYALSKNLRPHENVLFPRYKAFNAIVSTLRGELDGVIDATFMFQGDEPSVKASFAGTASTVVHVHMKHYPISEVPEDEQKLEEWLLERWNEKDIRIGNFNRDVASLGMPNANVATTRPSVTPLYALVGVFLTASLTTIWAASKVRNGLFILFITSLIAISVTGVFTVMNLRPSKKGSGTSRKSR